MSYNIDATKEYKANMSIPSRSAIDTVNRKLDEYLDDGLNSERLKSPFSFKSDREVALSVMSKEEIEVLVKDSFSVGSISKFADEKEVGDYFLFAKQHPVTGGGKVSDNLAISAATIFAPAIAAISIFVADKEGMVLDAMDKIGNGVMGVLNSPIDAGTAGLLAVVIGVSVAASASTAIYKNRQEVGHHEDNSMSKNQIISDIIIATNPKDSEIQSLRDELKSLSKAALCSVYEDHYDSEVSFHKVHDDKFKVIELSRLSQPALDNDAKEEMSI